MAQNESIPEETISLGETRQIELPSIDISDYVGRKVKVERVTEHKGAFGYYIKVVTEPVAELDMIDQKTGQKAVLRGSRVFGLQTDRDGNVGWGEKTKLGVFLNKKKVGHYKDLVGVEVVTTSITNSDDQKDYLSIN